MFLLKTVLLSAIIGFGFVIGAGAAFRLIDILDGISKILAKRLIK